MAEERDGTVSEVLDIIIGAGPRIGEALEEVSLGIQAGKVMVGHFHQAGVIIAGRSARTAEATVELDASEVAKVEQVEVKLAEAGGGRRGLLRDMFAFLKANPEILQFLLLFLKK